MLIDSTVTSPPSYRYQGLAVTAEVCCDLLIHCYSQMMLLCIAHSGSPHNILVSIQNKNIFPLFVLKMRKYYVFQLGAVVITTG